ncbi:hypothetical protein NBM05_05275 [Rothia sp. AR01]|uniref:PH domain-containing protein n=1 Tax=Rothia santali TaxID=2949643 RepID=A0A9X2HBY6_9MICC|nr:hypothetical protein [Rothia santali]MCP3425445.1 hypothetical protein [Rothia santali]
MAEHLRDVPEKYGRPVEGFHPRIHSYGRRFLAVVPASLLSAVLVLLLVYRRPAVPFVVLSLVVVAVSLVIAYSYLRPAIAVLTDTHVLRGRMIGWKAAPRAAVEHTVFAERLQPRGAGAGGRGALARFRNRGVPALWFVGAGGKRALRFDGRVWDAKTLQSLSSKVTPRTTRYARIEIDDLARRHPGLVGWQELHPRLRSGLLTAAVAVVLALIAAVNLWPEAFAL